MHTFNGWSQRQVIDPHRLWGISQSISVYLAVVGHHLESSLVDPNSNSCFRGLLCLVTSGVARPGIATDFRKVFLESPKVSLLLDWKANLSALQCSRWQARLLHKVILLNFHLGVPGSPFQRLSEEALLQGLFRIFSSSVIDWKTGINSLWDLGWQARYSLERHSKELTNCVMLESQAFVWNANLSSW